MHPITDRIPNTKREEKDLATWITELSANILKLESAIDALDYRVKCIEINNHIHNTPRIIT